ncbi:MAG: pyridoxamine 5'-phosphate oxidase [Candidatus Poribacteria bacterium]|nr:pyridoxamine 5'-phosphate oxidase [Candidatus Poribacteria bacterium]
MNTDKLRREYRTHAGHLLEQNASPNPFEQFEKWFADAIAAKLDLPDAMTLATATPRGIPSARMVVLRGFDAKGFCFYTDYESQKGKELAENPNAALVFYWRELDRQVRSTGTVEKMSMEESDAYFASRPMSSQLAVRTERQSIVISGREHLTAGYQQAEQTYASETIPRPLYWGGYRLVPNLFEFWQGCPNRLHDRLCYTLQPDGGWEMTRLSP